MGRKNPFKVFSDSEERPVKKLDVDETLIEEDLCKDLGFILDSSASWTPSTYMEIAYGVCDAMESCLEDGVERDYAIINYSSETISTGWLKSSSRQYLECIAHTFQGQSAHLDMYNLRQMVYTDVKKGLILIADGAIPFADVFEGIMKSRCCDGDRIGLILYRCPAKNYYPGMEEFSDVYETDDKNLLRPLIREYAEHLLGKDRPYL